MPFSFSTVIVASTSRASWEPGIVVVVVVVDVDVVVLVVDVVVVELLVVGATVIVAVLVGASAASVGATVPSVADESDESVPPLQAAAAIARMTEGRPDRHHATVAKAADR